MCIPFLWAYFVIILHFKCDSAKLFVFWTLLFSESCSKRRRPLADNNPETYLVMLPKNRLDSLVVEWWLQVQEVPCSNPDTWPRHTIDVIKWLRTQLKKENSGSFSRIKIGRRALAVVEGMKTPIYHEERTKSNTKPPGKTYFKPSWQWIYRSRSRLWWRLSLASF